MPVMLGLVGLSAAAIVAAGAGFEAVYRRRDFRTIRLEARSRTPWQELPAENGRRRFVCEVPFHNENARYEQTLVDVRPQVRLLTKDPLDALDARIAVSVRALNSDGRTDGYWAATLLSPNERTRMEVTVTLEAPASVRLHAAVVSLSYSTYGRGPLLPFDDEIVLPLSEVKPLPAAIQGENVAIQCVPTPILTDIDDIVEVIDRHTASFRQAGDLVAVAESVVAVTQRQYFRPTEVVPGFWAKRLCYFVPSKGSLSSQHGYQLAMNQVGAAKMIGSFFIGALGKLIGQKGWFYSLAGRPAELIDDLTGTMPPFDKYIVAGPLDPEGVVAKIKQRTGMEAAIVDANDLKRAMVLACTDGVEAADVSRMLLDNPFGNAAEQTPIVVLRRREGGRDVQFVPTGKGEAPRDPSRSV